MKKEIEIEIPTTPNFIRVGKESLALWEFSEKELRAIGQEWTEELIRKSKKAGSPL